MTKIRTILKSSTDADGKHAVLLLLSDRGKREYFSTGFSAGLDEFDTGKDGGRFYQGRGVHTFTVNRKELDGSIKSYTNKEANDTLATLEQRAGDILRGYNEKHISWSFEQFRNDFLNQPKRKLFLEYAKYIIQKEYVEQDRFKKAAIAEGALTSLEQYDSNLARKPFQDINVAFLQGYIKHCRAKGNTGNTIGIRLREIRRIFNIAIREKVITPELYPFSDGKEDGKIKIPKTELNRTDQYVTWENLQLIAQTTMKDYVLERTRHLFLFSYHCRGINWKDMALLTKDNFFKVAMVDTTTKKSKEVTVLQYKRSKTKGEFDIMVTANIKRELDWFKENTPLYGDFVLPIISVKVEPADLDEYLQQVRKRFNRSLKKLAKELGFPESEQKLSIYSARHSFAMTMQNLDKPVEVISQALGHKSVETTKHYLAKFSTTKMAEETDIDLLADSGEEKKVIKVAKTPRKPREPKIKEAPVHKEES